MGLSKLWSYSNFLMDLTRGQRTRAPSPPLATYDPGLCSTLTIGFRYFEYPLHVAPSGHGHAVQGWHVTGNLPDLATSEWTSPDGQSGRRPADPEHHGHGAVQDVRCWHRYFDVIAAGHPTDGGFLVVVRTKDDLVAAGCCVPRDLI